MKRERTQESDISESEEEDMKTDQAEGGEEDEKGIKNARMSDGLASFLQMDV